MPHLDEGLLHSLVDGEISGPELKALERHLADCAECRGRLEDARQLRVETLGMLEQLDEAPAMLHEPVAMPMFQRRPDLAAAAPPQGAAEAKAASMAPAARRPWRWMGPVGLAAAAVLAIVIRSRTSDAPAPVLTPSKDEAIALPARPTAPAAAPVAPATEPARDKRAEREAKASRRTTADALARADTPVAASGTVTATTAAQAAAPPPGRKIEAPVLKLDEVTAANPKPSPLTAKGDVLDQSARNLARPLQEAPTTTTAEMAIRALGGSIRLVDGLAPERYELEGIVVRVIYRTPWGPLALEQWRAGNVLAHRLRPAPGTPDDSVAAWTERIR